MRDEVALVGCGAIQSLDDVHAEAKSMRTLPSYKGKGVTSQLLQHKINYAKNSGIRRLSLEKGSMNFFNPAHGLYRKYGFDYCEPFAGYVKDVNSVFMTISLGVDNSGEKKHLIECRILS